MAGQYTDFQNIDSGENGTIEGLLPLEGDAEAFRYRKHISVNVIIPNAAAFIDLTGEWQMRLREDAFREGDSPEGAYTGRILFEQTVRWTARVVADPVAPFWMPLGDAGSGKQMTSICNGEACSVAADVNDAAAMAAYGETGAWRFVDGNLNDTATDRQKYDYEKGFTLFNNDGAGGAVGYQFFADWQSAGYLLEIPEGAILETVYDHWQFAHLDSEAHYQVSFKLGAGGSAISAICDGDGVGYIVVKDGSDLKVKEYVDGQATEVLRSTLVNHDAPSLYQIKNCTRFYLAARNKAEDKFVTYTSDDHCATWQEVTPMQEES